ncbi:hypothetical protein LCGC14_3158910, partial [marine sediment metagenome]
MFRAVTDPISVRLVLFYWIPTEIQINNKENVKKMVKYTIFGIISSVALILDLLSGDTKTIEIVYTCDPITIALIVGGALTAKSQIEQGRAARAQGRTQEAIAQRNALLAERQAEAEQQAAVAEARKQERAGEVLKGRQRAAF